MTRRSWQSLLALPANVLCTIPALLLWSTRDTGFWSWKAPSVGEPTSWLALPILGLGLALVAATIGRFDRVGQGTLAPWDPPKRLIVGGPYRYVRNPMISGVLFALVGEALLLRSPAIGLWALVFLVGNTIYFVVSEEPGLEARFGDDYRRYKGAVPRWIPRMRPWQGEDGEPG